MDRDAKMAAIDRSLGRAAEHLGDITPHVFARYYQAYPQALDVFEHHHPGARGALEGQMIEQVLYCLMRWFECPGEIEIILFSTIPHHIDTLNVGADHFTGLLTAVCDTLIGTIPPGQHDEQAVWAELRERLTGVCAQGADMARPRRRMNA